MAVQQRLVSRPQLTDAAASVPGRERRALVPLLVRDIVAGSESLGELDFMAMCRRRGLPPPQRQVIRKTPGGRVYLDVRWDGIGLVVEIDGSGHRQGLAVTDDNLRQNQVAIEGDTVLRIDLIGLRVAGDAFMDQVCAAHARLRRAWAS